MNRLLEDKDTKLGLICFVRLKDAMVTFNGVSNVQINLGISVVHIHPIKTFCNLSQKPAMDLLSKLFLLNRDSFSP